MPSIFRRNLETPAREAYISFYKIRTSGFMRDLTNIRQLPELLSAGNKLTGEKSRRIRFCISAVFHSVALRRDVRVTDKKLNLTIVEHPFLGYVVIFLRNFIPDLCLPLFRGLNPTCSRLNNFALTVITRSFLLTPLPPCLPVSRAVRSSVSLNFTRAGTKAGNSAKSYAGGCGDSARTNQCTLSLYEVCISRPVHRAKLLSSNAETAIRGKRFCGVYDKAPSRETVW